MSAASRITVAVTGAATTIFIARLLGPDGAGGYAIAQTIVALLTVAATLGVEHGVTYYVTSGRWAARSAHRAAQRVALVTGVAAAAFGLALRLLVPSAFGDLSVALTAVVLFAVPFSLSWFYVTYVALATDHYEAYVLPSATQSAVGLVLVIALAAAFDLSGAVVGFAVAHVVTALVVLAWARRRLALPRPGDPADVPGQLRRAIRFGIKGYAANALQFVNYRIDVFVLAGVANAAAVGQYSVAIAVTSAMWLLPQALSDVLFPRVAALRAQSGTDAESMREFVEAKTLRHTVLIVVAMTIVLAGALLLLVVPVYGPAFQPAVELGLILLPGVALIGIAGTISATIVGHGRPGYMLAVALVSTPITVTLYALLIPALDAKGAALGSTISYSLNFLLAAIFYRRVTGARLLPRLLPTRSELDDYRALTPAIVQWLRNLRARTRTVG